MDQVQAPRAVDEAKMEAFVERVIESTLGTFDMLALFVGHKLGYYTALASGEAMTSSELAARTDTQERYAREWLEQQTVTGVLTVDDPLADALSRRYTLPAEHVEPLTEVESGNYVAPLAYMLAGVMRPLEQTLEAYRKGGGVPYIEYGEDFVKGQAAINRPAFMNELAQDWLPTMDDLRAKLESGDSVRVADIGMGAGWSSIGMAKHYANVTVDGYDLDEASVELARKNADQAGLNGRVKFYARDAAEADGMGQYDLVTAFEAIHDMSDPVSVLKTMRALVRDGGVVLIADERVGDTLLDEKGDVDALMYGWSFLHCLPVGMSEQPSVGTGTVMRTETLRQYAFEAGFLSVEVLPVDNFFFRFYRLR